MSKKQKTAVPDAYDENERSISIEDAHRDTVYDVPSSFSQIMTCFSMQMKMYSKKTFSLVFFFILLAIIPLAVATSKSTFEYSTVNENMAVALSLLPLFSLIFACSSCGKMLPREFHERTIYLTAPLPMNKSSLFIGKFLAGFAYTAAKILLAYGVAMASCRFLLQWNDVYYVPILESFAVAMCAVFFYCSFAYMFSTFTKRGSTAVPFIMIAIFMTGAFYGLDILAAIKEIAVLPDIAAYMPSLSCDFALSCLGDYQAHGVNWVLGSLINMSSTMFPLCKSVIISCGVNVLLSLICLYIGFIKISGRKI